jgi:hypothetical protein
VGENVASAGGAYINRKRIFHIMFVSQ